VRSPVGSDRREPEQEPAASRRGYLVALGALAVVGTAAVVTSRRLDAARLAEPAGGASSTRQQPRPAGSPLPAAGGGDAGIDLPVGPAAPPVRPTAWLNTAPLTSQELAGHAVLYYFWTFECINCQHVQPYVKAWHSRYRQDGLIVLSIHTPEFSVEADPRNVADYVTEHRIGYPVALDPGSRVWRAFGNRYWPAWYLHDQQGRRRFTHAGEGAYVQTEEAIRQLLRVTARAPRAVVA
jgi:thiol-disulfide isomerase/thioredoxin